MNTQMYAPPLSYINKIVIIAMVALFVLSSIVESGWGLSLTSILGLSLNGLSQGYIFQIFTFPLIEHGFFSVLFSGLILWFIGSDLERLWGMRNYLYFLLSCLIGGALFFLFVAAIFSLHYAPLSGMAGVASGLCIAYAVLYPDRLFTFMLLFPMKAKYFCLLLAGISLYNGFFSPARAGAWGQIGMMLCAFLWVAWKSGLMNQKMASYKKSSTQTRQKRVKKSHLKLIKQEDDEDGPPKYWH